MIYSINEGQQAEEYKARKEKEKHEDQNKYKDQALRRYPSPANNWKDNYGKQYTTKNPTERKDVDAALAGDKGAAARASDGFDKDSRRMSKSSSIGNRDYYSGKRPMNGEENARANDAINRHIRRHPKQYKEGTIFESVEFI